MAYEPRSVYEFEEAFRAPAPPCAPIVIPVPPALQAAHVIQSIEAADGAVYALTYRIEQRPEGRVGVLETCEEASPRRG